MIKISLAGTIYYCPHCKKSVWFHKLASGGFICRGQMRPSEWPKLGDAPEIGVGSVNGCGYVKDNKNNGSIRN